MRILDEQPNYLNETGGLLHEIQLDAINCLRHLYSAGKNSLLADESGLEKTLQTVVFLYSLYKEVSKVLL